MIKEVCLMAVDLKRVKFIPTFFTFIIMLCLQMNTEINGRNLWFSEIYDENNF
jgi:hypothetical protein